MKTAQRIAIASAIAALLILSGCGSSDSEGSQADTNETTTTAAAAAEELEIRDVWARTSPMATTAGAVYMTITSPIDDALVMASVPTSVAGTTEIHETVAADDAESGDMASSTTEMGAESGSDMSTTTAMGEAGSDMSTSTEMGGSDSMTMRPVDSIELPAGETVKLEPGGYHVMLLELAAPLTAGQTFPVTLTFEEAGTQEDRKSVV